MSVSIALFSRRIFAPQLSKMSGSKLIVANAFLNYIASAAAGASNLVLMRYKELEQGISIKNEKGDKEYGKSKAAGKKAILETAVSRMVLPLPVLFFPALAHSVLSKIRLWPRSSTVGKAMELFLCICSLTFALPMSIALFEQRAVLSRDQIDD